MFLFCLFYCTFLKYAFVIFTYFFFYFTYMIMFHIFVVAEILLLLLISTVVLHVEKKFKNSQGTESFYAFYVLYGQGVVLYLLRSFSHIWVSCKSPNLPSKLNAVCASFCFLLVFINTLKQHHTYYKQVHSLACLLTLYIMVMYV